MNDEAMRRAMHAAVDECFGGVERLPSQRTKVLDRIEGKRRAGKLSAVPALALVLALLLACGVAASMGLFGQIRESKVDEMSYTRLERLEEAAQPIGQTQTLTVPGTDHEIELTVNQAYCDGRKLYYSYALKEDASQVYRSFVGDGANLPDGTSLPPVDSGYGETEDGARTAYYEVELPEDRAFGEHITFELLVMVYENGNYMKEKSVHVPVTVPVTGNLTILRGEGMLDGRYTKVRLFVSDVDVSGRIESLEEDVHELRHLELVADGVRMPMVDWMPQYGADLTTIEARFDLPDSAQDAAYALASGDEMLELTKGE